MWVHVHFLVYVDDTALHSCVLRLSLIIYILQFDSLGICPEFELNLL